MIYLVIGIGIIIGFWMVLDLICDHEPAPGPLNRVLHAPSYRARKS
ncbi:MAG: hypothetical protein MZV65_38265 [Chromatiales bacterium]|nr:hypothetical protein [Chromatiales bacterium]